MVSMKKIMATGLLAALLACAGCAGLAPTTFLHPEYNFGFLEKVAVVPFENLTTDQGAGARATRIFLTELLAAEVFDVVEPGEVQRALLERGWTSTAQMTREDIVAVGRELQVQGLFLATVSESGSSRGGSGAESVVTLDTRLVECETGITVWSATHTEDSRGFWSTLFGTAQKSRSEVTRRCVARCLDTLID